MNPENSASLNTLASIASVSFLADLLSVVSASSQTQRLDFSGLVTNPSLTVGSNEDNVFFFVPRSPLPSVLFSAGGDDVVYVGEGRNFIVAADTTRQSLSEHDYVNLGEGIDTVFLGDTAGSYYTENGWGDHLYVDGFNTSVDQLLLFGDRTLYQVKSTEQGSWLLWGETGKTAIAYLNGVTQLDLASDAFIYTGADTANTDTANTDTANTDIANTDIANTDAEPATPTPVPSEPVSPEPVSPEPDTARSSEFYAQLGIPQFEDVVGSLANDQLLGGDGAQQLIGFGGNDYAVGGVGSDLFILGDFGSSYYAQQGWQDSVYIEDFEAGVDQLQLQGVASQYSTTTDQGGTWLYDGGDAIAYLKNVDTVDLNRFEYLAL
ncbi:MAG: hypothetical protein AAFP03_00090 [Cyanobacteria bacterium J06598_3]